VINLRYHIVSIVAVFLALAVGVVMGSTFIAGSELDFLKERQDSLRDENRQVRAANDDLRRELGQLREFQEEAEDPLLAGDLEGVPVTVVAVRGIESEPADELRRQLANAGAASQGTIWLTRKLRLDNRSDVEALATAVGIAPGDAVETRDEALRMLAASLGGTSPVPSVVPALQEAGFIEVEPPATGAATTTSTVATSTSVAGEVPPATPPRVVVLSGAGAETSDDEVAIPLVRALAGARTGVIAVEAGNDDPGGREVFVGPLRRDDRLAPGVSTIDNLETFTGRAALVVLLGQPAGAAVGHFGVGPQAQREVPPPVPES
jgi:hypothetical protein